MPVEMKWFDEKKRNLVCEFSAHWTWDDCFVAIDKAVLLLDSIDYRVCLILDFRPTTYIPAITFDALNRIAKSETPKHPNTRSLIMIGLNRNITMGYNIFQKIFPAAASRYHVVKDAAELEAMLKAASNAN
jgi:hypothetical protein